MSSMGSVSDYPQIELVGGPLDGLLVAEGNFSGGLIEGRIGVRPESLECDATVCCELMGNKTVAYQKENATDTKASFVSYLKV